MIRTVFAPSDIPRDRIDFQPISIELLLRNRAGFGGGVKAVHSEACSNCEEKKTRAAQEDGCLT